MCEPSDESTREVLGTAVTGAADSQTTTFTSSSSQNIVPDFLTSSTSVEWNDPLSEGGFGDVLQSAQDDPSGRNLFSELCGPQQLSADQVEKFLNETNTSAQYVDSALDPSIEESINSMLRDNDPMLTSTSVENFKLDIGVFDNPSEGLSLVNPEPGITADINPDTFLKDLNDVSGSSQTENKMEAMPTRRSPRVAGIAPTTVEEEETKAQGDKVDTPPQKKEAEQKNLRRSSRIQRKDDSGDGVTPSPRTRGRAAKSSPQVQKTPPMARRTRASAMIAQTEAPVMESDTATTGEESFQSPPRTRRQAAAKSSPAKKTAITPKRAAALLQKAGSTVVKKTPPPSKESASPPTLKESPSASKETEVPPQDISAEESQEASQEIPSTPQKTVGATQETPTTPQQTQALPKPQVTPSKTQITPTTQVTPSTTCKETPVKETAVSETDASLQKSAALQELETPAEASVGVTEKTAAATEEDQGKEETESSPNNTRKSSRIQVKEKEEAERVELDRVRMLDHDYAQPVAEKLATKKKGGKSAEEDDATSSSIDQEPSELKSESTEDTESKTTTPKRGGRKKGAKKVDEDKKEQEMSEETKEDTEEEKDGEKGGRKKVTTPAKKQQERTPKRAATSKKGAATKSPKDTPPSAKKAKRKSEVSESEEEDLPLKRLMEEMHKEKAQEVISKQQKQMKKPERKRRKSSVQIVEVEEPILFTPDNAAPLVKEEEVKGHGKKDGGPEEEAPTNKEGVKPKEIKTVKTEKPSTSTKEERRKSLDKEDTKKVAKDKERQRKDSVKSEKSDKEHQGDESGAESDDSGMTFSDDPNDSDWEDEDPDKAYCICRKPHGKRFMICCDRCEEWYHGDCVGITKKEGIRLFMICCDRCEEWYHGDCVGITKKEGIRLEKNSEDYICPRCKEKDAKEKAVVESEPKGEQDKEGSDDASTSKKMKSREEHSKTGKAAKKDPSKKGEEGSETLKRQKSKEEEKESEKESPTAKKKKIKIFKEKYHPRQKCIGAGCSNWAQRGSVYCSNNCILSHARESLKLINKEKQKYGLLDAHAKKDPKASPAKPDSTSHGHHKKIPTSPPATSTEKGKKDPERVAVIERSTGRLLAGLSAPTEDNLSQWLETHPTYEVLRPEVKQTQTYGKEAEKGKKGQSSKPIELDPVRLNVRRALKDLLKDRQDKCDTMKKKRSPEDIMKAASAIETELHKLYNDTGTRYKSKYRSLMFNLKDARNTTLFKRVLTGEIRPHKLVKMSPEELACKELAQWRDRETKHTLEMIVKKEQEEAQMEKHLTKKTHKGEIEIDDDLGELKTEKSDEKEREEGYIPATAEAEGPDVLATMLVDTTEQHRAHLFDLNCKICTGRMAPPTDEQPAKKVKVAKTVIEASSTTKPEESSTAESPGPTVDTTTGSPTDPLVQSDTEDSSPDSAMPSQSELPSSKEPSVWKGFIKMEQLTKFVTHAYPVSGSMEDIQEDLPDTIMISGRISHSHIWEYLDKIKSSGNKEISIIRFQPAVDEEKVGYIMLYSYFHSRQRFGVVGNNSRQVKDMYLIPLPSHEEVPYQLKPFDGPGLEEPRPHMLLGLIIRNRMAKRSATSSSESTPLHASPKHRRYSEISGTPPSAGSPSVASGSKHRHHHHHHHHRRHHSQEHDRKQQVEQKKEEPKRKSETATPVPAKKVYTIPEHEISDPIVKQYANVDPSALIPRTSQDEMEEMPYSPGQAAQEEEEEQPYDPGDEDFLPVEEGVDSPPPQSPPAQQDSDSDSVLEVGIGQSDSNEASASQSEPSLDNILMTPLGDNPTLSEQQRLLIELTKQVEEQKKLLLEQQKNLESICSGPNSATGSPVVEFPTGDAKTVSTVGENIRVTVTQVLTTVASTQAVSSATASSSKTAAAEKKTDTASSVSTSGKVEGSDSPELPMIPGLGGDLTPPVNIPGLGGTSVGTAVATSSASSSAVQEKAEEKAPPSRPKEKVSEAVSKLTSSGAAGASTSGSFEIPANISELLQKVSSIVKQTSQATSVVTQQPLVQQAQIPQAGLSGYLPQMSQIPSTGFQQAPGQATQAPIGQQIPGAPIGSFGGTWTANQSTAQTGQQYMPPQSAPEGQVQPTGQPAPAVGERRSDDPGREHGHHHGDSRQPSGPYPGYDPRNVQRFEYNEQGRQVRRDSGDDRHHRDRWHDRRDDRRDSRRDDRRDDHREERRGSRDHGWGREGGRDRERERDRDRDRDRDRWRQDRNTRDKGRGGQWQDSHRRR